MNGSVPRSHLKLERRRGRVIRRVTLASDISTSRPAIPLPTTSEMDDQAMPQASFSCRHSTAFRAIRRTTAKTLLRLLARHAKVGSCARMLLIVLSAFAGFTLVSDAYAVEPSSSATRPEPMPLQRGLSLRTPGQAEFVRVPDTTLYFSPHLLPRPSAPVDAAGQLESILDDLAIRLRAVDSDARQLLRLTLTLVDESDQAAAAAVLARRFPEHAPAVTWLGSPVAESHARVAVEAIAASPRPVSVTTITSDGGALLPAGPRIFLSGQAERGQDVPESVALTMASLLRSAEELGGSASGVAQIRVFLRPFSSHADALAKITPLFPRNHCPPVLVSEWTLPIPVEIEMILAGDSRPSADPAPLRFPVLAGKPRSPRFSHAAMVGAGVPLVFLGGIAADSPLTPADEWPALFAHLGLVLGRAGSSFRLLVKATYLLEDESPRPSLNDTRAVYYDPLRPPAASAVGVRSVGIPGRAASLDLIAVPRDAVATSP